MLRMVDKKYIRRKHFLEGKRHLKNQILWILPCPSMQRRRSQMS